MIGKKTALALIPARSGSKRVPGKNIKRLAGHPLIAYTIAAAKNCGFFDRVVFSTDSQEYRDIALYYGADAPFLRPSEFATSTSPDIEWLKHALSEIDGFYECVAKLNPTSPFRTAATITRAMNQFLGLKGVDSLRAVKLCHEHPGKMWTITGDTMKPYIDQTGQEVAYHARQYQDLPEVYIQDSSLEVFWEKIIWETNTREGKVVAPFLTEGWEGFAIDYEEDWLLAEHLVESGKAKLPKIKQKPYPNL